MPAHLFHPGDPCWLSVTVTNPTEHLLDKALFVILDVYGTLFFWPEWNEFGYMPVVLQPKTEEVIEVIPEFYWPAGTGSASGIIFLGGMTDPEVAVVSGVVTRWEFEWRD